MSGPVLLVVVVLCKSGSSSPPNSGLPSSAEIAEISRGSKILWNVVEPLLGMERPKDRLRGPNRKASGLGAAPKMAQGMETVQPEIGLALALSTPEMICHLGWTSEDPNLQTDSHEPACQGRSVMVEPRRSGSGSPKMCWPQLALPLVIAGWVGRRGRGGCPHVTPWAASNGSSRRVGRHWPRCRRT